jgi:antitoxin ParD1/3/4
MLVCPGLIKLAIGFTLPTGFMNVSLTKRQKNFVQEKVRSGNYQSASEVVREALRVLETLETENNSLEEQILEGIESGPAKPITKGSWKKLKSRLHREREQRQRKPHEARSQAAR